MHFEDIWNEAEEIAMEVPGADRTTNIKRLKTSVDRLEQAFTSKERGEIIGSILFELCAFCKWEENLGEKINSAAALRMTSEKMKEVIELLENENKE